MAQRYNHPNNNRQVANVPRLPEPGELVSLASRGAAHFARRNPIITGAYVFGWVFLLFVGNGAVLTVQQQRQYNQIMVRGQHGCVLYCS